MTSPAPHPVAKTVVRLDALRMKVGMCLSRPLRLVGTADPDAQLTCDPCCTHNEWLRACRAVTEDSFSCVFFFASAKAAASVHSESRQAVPCIVRTTRDGDFRQASLCIT